MSTYEYITIFTSIILGLAIVNVLSGISVIIHKGIKTVFYWIHTIWVINIFTVILLLWWNNLILNDLPELSFLHYLNLVAYSVVLYLMSSLLFPVKFDESINFKKLFYDNRKTLYIMGMVFVITDLCDATLEKIVTDGAFRIPQLVNISIYFILFLLGLKINKPAFHGVVALVFSAGLLIWFFLTMFVGYA